MKVLNKLFRFQNNYSPLQIIYDSFQAGLQVRSRRLDTIQQLNIIKSHVPITNPSFYKVPYHEQYESRDISK